MGSAKVPPPPPPEDDADQALDGALAAFYSALDAGESISRDEFLSRFPQLAPQLTELLEAADWIESMAGPTLESLGSTDAWTPFEAPWNSDLSADPTFRGQPPRADDASPAPDADMHLSDVTMQLGNDVSPDEADEAAAAAGDDRPIDPTGFDSTLPIKSQGPRVRLVDNLVEATAESTQPMLPCRFGDYVLERILGRGGMGVVYLAHQVNLERPVAIKMIRSGCLAGEEEIQRFYAEARSAARLDHPNIVSVHQCGEIDGHHFFSMDFIPGSDLARLVQAGALSPITAARYARDVARTIAYAHRQGVLHRDLKPANVLVDEQDQVVITDFGLAKLMGSESGLTRSGAALGTPSYMSPEQAAGNPAEHGAMTDVYSIGAILYALLIGKPPFQATTAVQTIMDVIHQPAPSLRAQRLDIPIELDTIVGKCLRKIPTERYANAADLADELDRFLRGEPILARPTPWYRRAARWLGNVPIIAALFGHRAADPSPAHRWVQRGLLAGVVLTALLLALGVRGSRWLNDHRLPSQVRVAGGAPGGAYHDVGAYLVETMQQHTGRAIDLLVTEGSTDNYERLLQGQVEVALLQATAVRGGRVSVIAPLYHEAVHLLVRQTSNIQQLSDLRGKVVAIGADESGTHQATRILLSYLDDENATWQLRSIDWQAAVLDPDVDAAFAVIRAGHTRLREILESGEFRLISLPRTQYIALNEPAFRQFDMEASDYPSLGQSSVQTLATTAYLACRSDASSRLVEACLEAIYTQQSTRQELIPARRAAHWQGLPLHPAARRYFETILEKESADSAR